MLETHTHTHTVYEYNQHLTQNLRSAVLTGGLFCILVGLPLCVCGSMLTVRSGFVGFNFWGFVGFNFWGFVGFNLWGFVGFNFLGFVGSNFLGFVGSNFFDFGQSTNRGGNYRRSQGKLQLLGVREVRLSFKQFILS